MSESMAEFCFEEGGFHWIRFPTVVTFHAYASRYVFKAVFQFELDRTRIGLDTRVVFKHCFRIKAERYAAS
jgi:hypothetical protein